MHYAGIVWTADNLENNKKTVSKEYVNVNDTVLSDRQSKKSSDTEIKKSISDISEGNAAYSLELHNHLENHKMLCNESTVAYA